MSLLSLMRGQAVVPVVVLDDVAAAVPLARALVAGGLPVIEVTLRTAVALDAICAIADEVPDAIVGAGTLTGAADVRRAVDAGALFGVSPGCTPQVVAATREHDLPLLPGVMTPSEVMAARAAGFSLLKLFPATVAGGTQMLDALRGPFPDVLLCPTGGITATNAAQFLALPNVACVGGTWVAPKALVARGDWAAITTLARAAAGLGRAAAA